MNFTKNILASLLFLLITSIQAQDVAFIEFNDEKVDKDEFVRVYKKNNSGEMISKSTVDEYLELYINFKLKVKEAEARGLDTISFFRRELAGYRSQLARPYLSAESIIEELKKEAYERYQEDVRVKHLLIRSKIDDSPEDTLKAYNKTNNLRKQLINGADFEKLARTHSEDPNVKNDGGDLGYFTAFHMVYPFESAAFETSKGEISDIVRTRFGYHILKVIDRRPAFGRMDAAHILISTDPVVAQNSDPKAKAAEIYRKLIEDKESFEDMATQFSDDKPSAKNGGILKTFTVGKMVPEFEAAAFALENDGDITEPVQTQFGWHIIKRLKRHDLPSYKKMESELTNKVERDSRSALTQVAMINRIKKQYGFKENFKEVEDFYEIIDESYFKGKWDINSASKLKKTIFSIGEKELSQQDFSKFLKRTQTKRPPVDVSVLVNQKYEAFKRMKLLEYKDSKLDEEYPDFAYLMEEYHDGILLFNLTEELVWKKASDDTIGLKDFYEKNKENYRWEKRILATVYSCLDETIAKQTRELIASGLDLEKIMDTVNRSSQLNLKYERSRYEMGDNELVDQVDWKVGVSENAEMEGRINFVHVQEILEPTYKTLDDSRGLITADYQEYLEKEWIKSLRDKYSYKVDSEILDELRKELN